MLPVSIRFNNAGAVNTSSWVRAMPGFIEDVETTKGNRTARFRTPEQGVAVWWELLRRYRLKGVTTVGSIISTYGGGQDYSEYAKFVVLHSGLLRSTPVTLDNDRVLLALAQAMFAYEAGVEAWAGNGLTARQIIAGFNEGRRHAGVPVASPTAPTDPQATSGTLGLIKRALGYLWGAVSAAWGLINTYRGRNGQA